MGEIHRALLGCLVCCSYLFLLDVFSVLFLGFSVGSGMSCPSWLGDDFLLTSCQRTFSAVSSSCLELQLMSETFLCNICFPPPRTALEASHTGCHAASASEQILSPGKRNKPLFDGKGTHLVYPRPPNNHAPCHGLDAFSFLVFCADAGPQKTYVLHTLSGWLWCRLCLPAVAGSWLSDCGAGFACQQLLGHVCLIVVQALLASSCWVTSV